MTHADFLIKTNLVTAKHVIADAYIGVRDGVITHAGPLAFDALKGLDDPDIITRPDLTVLPGLIDLQVNGGGGILFSDATTIAELHTIINAHRAYGTTGILATLLTDAPEQIEQQIAFIASAIATDPLCQRHLLGIHLEGPFFNVERRGTHPLQFIMPPDTAWMERWVNAANGCLKIVTLAPELPRALDVIRLLTDRGVCASLGHSEATYEEASRATEAGARMGTHLYNAMSQLQGRAPGLVGALLDWDVDVGLINDGHHVHDASLKNALRVKTYSRSFFVSDAMHVLGLAADSVIDYRGETIYAKDGACVNARGKFAGSASPLLTALQRGVTHLDMDICNAWRMCCDNPAKILNLPEHSQLKVGDPADFIVLDADLKLVQL